MSVQKSLKNKKKTHKSTLDQKHQSFINEYKTNVKNLIPQKYLLQKKLNELNDLINENNNNNSLDNVTKIATLRMEIDNIEKDIIKVESGDNLFEYSIRNYDLLKQYYILKKNGMIGGSTSTPASHVKRTLKLKDRVIPTANQENVTPNNGGSLKKHRDKGIMSYFKTDTNKDIVNDDEVLTPSNLNSFYEKYRSMNDSEYIVKTNGYTRLCPIPICQKELIISYRDGSYYCDCGYIETSLVSIEKINYKEPSQEKNTNNAYRRINHLTEIMSQIQANESTEIPHNVFIDIRKELKKRRINKNRLDVFLLRRILKGLKFSKYYEHTPHILQIINGKVPPKFTKYYENKIKQMFRDIQKPFEIYRPTGRKNFLSYSYVLHKFCELLELDQYLDYFPLLKNINKLKQHDKIWKSICAHMRWKYYAST